MSQKSKKRKKNRNVYFFAYQSSTKSKNCDNADAIKAVADSLGNIAITWEQMKVNGKLINKQILNEIDKAEVFVCDLTYLNANVFFELGYAIGKKKRLLILLNNRVKDASLNYSNITILKGVGYVTFNNSQDIRTEIDKTISENSKVSDIVLLDQLSRLPEEEFNTTDVFYIKSSGYSQAEIDTIEFIKSSCNSQICDDSYEISYQTLDWYLNALNKSKNIVIHLSANDKISSEKDNSINSLYAGIGLAMGKRVLFVAPSPYYAPMDYNDMLIEYNSSSECVEMIKNWLPKPKKEIHNSKLLQEDMELNLLKLGIGYSIAEDEKISLLSYFIETHAYNLAKQSRSSIFYGRKGAGKTALYIMLIDYFRQKDNVFLVGLKPESTELIDNINVSNIYEEFTNRKTLFHSIWKFVLYSKLLLDINKNIIDSKKIEYSNIEQDIIDYCEKYKEIINLNFLGTLGYMTDESKKKNTTAFQIIEEYNKKFLIPMLEFIVSYLDKKKYYKIAIIADNLDKAWDLESDLSLQTEMILSLLEVTGKLESTLKNKTQNNLDTITIVFLRSDIYKFIINKSREPDKLTVNSHEIEWKSCKPLLKGLVEKRMEFILELTTEDKISNIWKTYFDFGKEEAMNLVLNACLSRPRDIIFFFGKMFESACNNSRLKVTTVDYEYAVENYSNFLYQNLIAEMRAEYPYIQNILLKLHAKFEKKIELKGFRQIVNEYEKDAAKIESLIKDLFVNEYLIASDSSNNEKYLTYEDLLFAEREINSNRWKLLNRRYIYIFHHPRYSRVKDT